MTEEVWSVATAEHLLRVNAGTSPESGGPNYDPQLLLALDDRLAEPAALVPEGMEPLRALAEKHPFEEMRSTPQAVLDRQGFLTGTDESVEMYWVRSDDFLGQDQPPANRQAFLTEGENAKVGAFGYFPEWGELDGSIIGPGMQSIWAGEATPEEALGDICAQVDAFLAENGYPK